MKKMFFVLIAVLVLLPGGFVMAGPGPSLPTITGLSSITANKLNQYDISSTSPYGSLTFSVNWGDGQTEPAGNISGGVTNMFHRWLNSGAYTITVTATDVNNAQSVNSFLITVSPDPGGTVSAFNLSPSSYNFTANQGDTTSQLKSGAFVNITNSNITFQLSVDSQPSWLNSSYNTSPMVASPNQISGLGAGINPTGLTQGNYSTNIKISGNFNNSPIVIPINLTINPPTGSSSQTLSIGSFSLPSATVGQAYSSQAITFNSTGNSKINVKFTGLPDGMGMPATLGTSLPPQTTAIYSESPGPQWIPLVGTPSAAGTYNATLTLDNGSGLVKTQNFSLVVSPGSNSLAIVTTNLPDATIGQSYSTTIQASGGVLPYSWLTVSTTYPSGCCILGLNGNSQPLSTPYVTFNTQSSSSVADTYQSGTYSWVLKLTDAAGTSVTKTVYLKINSAGSSSGQGLQFVTSTTGLPTATVGQTFATGIDYTYTGQHALNATFTSLPPGLYTAYNPGSLTNIGMAPYTNGGKGTVYISGTPTQAGTFNVDLYITDPNYVSGQGQPGISKTFTITINPSSVVSSTSAGLFITPTALNFTATQGSNPASQSIQFSNNGMVNATWSVAKTSVPSGWFALSSTSGIYPAGAAGFGFTVSVDTSGLAAGTYAGSLALTGNFAQINIPINLTVTGNNTTANSTTSVGGIGLPDGTVLKLPSSQTVYLVSGGQLKPFTSSQDFLGQGYKWSDVQQVNPNQVTNLPVGNNNSGSGTSSFYPYPSGSIVNDNGTIYFINGATKIPFTNYDAFVGLGYLQSNIIVGDLTNYKVSSSYFITTANAEHPWGSWLIYKGTVYYSTQQGLIGVPSSQILISNGGSWNLLVKANSYDVALLNTNPNLPNMTMNDPRVYSATSK